MITEGKPYILITKDMSLQDGLYTILDKINMELHQGESMAITGSSGSGKSSLGKVLAGITPASRGEVVFPSDLKRIMVDQQDRFINQSGKKTTYYSQRYESIGEDDSPEVFDYLSSIKKKADTKNAKDGVVEVIELLQIKSIANRKLLQLSNGERKRTQIAAALLQKPDLLVLDQPFSGLDSSARSNLDSIINQLTKANVSLIIICDFGHIPESVQKILELRNGKVSDFVDRKKYHSVTTIHNWSGKDARNDLFELLPPPKERFNEVVNMKNVKVTFKGEEILNGINWQIKSGEQWALLGPNGAGKTTLLSLITADNPQGYSNNLTLFDRKRGSGESIWDIKKRIGFVSSELHLYFLRGGGIYNSVPGLGEKPQNSYDSLSCLDVIISGFKDEVGCVSSPTGFQQKVAKTWLSIFQLEHLFIRKFYQASLGEQRSLLLARALVKSPSLLILDEPCQGLDSAQIKHFKFLIDIICKQLQTTMIYVTHIPEEIPTCVTNLLLLENGKVVRCEKKTDFT